MGEVDGAPSVGLSRMTQRRCPEERQLRRGCNTYWWNGVGAMKEVERGVGGMHAEDGMASLRHPRAGRGSVGPQPCLIGEACLRRDLQGIIELTWNRDLTMARPCLHRPLRCLILAVVGAVSCA